MQQERQTMIDQSNIGEAPLDKVIWRALMAEREGHSFYVMAALTTRDPKGREVFEQLARDEMSHIQFLRTHFEAVHTSGTLATGVVLDNPSPLNPTSPIFSDEIKSRIHEAHLEMTALAIGMQLELDSIAYYRRQASEATGSDVRSIFSRLAEWEDEHYRALFNQHEQLKDQYWRESGFQPF